MSRRGFFAELHHQAVLAARENERAKRAAVREHNEAVRDSDRKRKEAERRLRDAEHDRVRDSRSAEAERKRLEHEASEAHVAAMEAEAEARTFKVAEVYTEIDSLLAAALKVDDYVDLETLRVVVKHPPFNRPELEAPAPAPDSIPDPPKPIFVAPDPPKGFAKLFGKTRHAEALAKAQQAHELALSKWRAHHDQVTACRTAALTTYADAEARRVVVLETERARYAKECTAREAEAAERNSQLDELIANLGYGTVMAVQEYVSIVLSNSVYPEHFAVTHEFEFEASSAELKLRVLVPGPDKIPEIKGYKYSKSTDEITATALSQKVCRERYAGAVHQVALRSIHEVFGSDRRGLIKTISLEVGTETVDPATGLQTYIPFVVVGGERKSFLEFNLAAVVPALTLGHLGAAVSKDPYGLVAVETSGVRRL